MARRFAAFALSTSLVVSFLAAPAPAAAQTLPKSMAATGDSITRAFNLCFFPFTDCPAQSWSTGTNTTVNSHARRLRITSTAYNDAVSGARMADLPSQANSVFGRNVDYVTVLMGGNDVCTDTEGQMTSPGAYEASFRTAMDKLATDSTPPLVYVVSVPNVKVLWEILKDNSTARSRWSSYNICQSLLANPLSTAQPDVDRRERVKQRTMELNQRLRSACAAYAFCRFDGERVFGTPFVPNDVSTRDYFHPSTAGQAKLAETSFAYGPYATSAVNDAPRADFSWTCSGLTCSFTDLSSDPSHAIGGWSWNFDTASGAGPTSTAQSPTHTFPAAGTYQVKLHAIDAFGATDSIMQSVTVSAGGTSNAPPTASFTVNCTDLSCTFDGAGSSDSDGTISSYSWNFGDGTTATGARVSRTYAGSGTYTVTLTVTDNVGATNSTDKSVTVSAANVAPTASFSFNCSGLTCSFDGTPSTDSDGTISSYAWNFGDGTTATGATVSRTYASSGTYTVSLTVTDSGGATGGTSQSVTVSAPAGAISLSVSAFKVKGVQHADLTWSGATSANVDVYRNGAKVATIANSGSHTDNIGQKGSGSYTYKVCEAGTTTCSPEVSVSY